MIDLVEDLRIKMRKMDEDSLEKARAKYYQDSEKDGKILEDLNKDTFTFRLELMILIGTIFGSSIALSTGKDKNVLFIMGEIYLFTAIVFGMVLLLSYMKGREWWHSFTSKSRIDFFLIQHAKVMSGEDLKFMKESAITYQRIMDTNQSGFSYLLLKVMPIEIVGSNFNYLFIVGVFCILISLIY